MFILILASGVDPFTLTHFSFHVPLTTDNPLQIAILNLFISLKSRYPNLVVGSVTRESVKKALNNGITADQVRSPSGRFLAF